MRMLPEAKRLYKLGLAIHWIKPNSKAPVKSGWADGTRDSWKELKRTFRKGYGLGVRLGKASKVKDGYLAVIDVDVKGEDPRYYREAIAVVKRKFPGLKIKKTARVETGRGNGSCHIYVVTAKPVMSGKLGSSNVDVKVYSPTTEPNRRQIKLLTPEELAKGIRVKKAWEVEMMSMGKQVVLPPTVHPDTGRPYRWSLNLLEIPRIPQVKAPFKGDGNDQQGGSSGEDAQRCRFEPQDVDLYGSTLSDHMVDMIVSGDGVEDRSNAVFAACLAMAKAGFTDDQIYSVLTDRDNFLGEVAYDHRKTNNRYNAAAWLRDYGVKKARREVSAAKAFEGEMEELPPLSKKKTKKQTKSIEAETDWLGKLDRTISQDGPGNIKPTVKNIVDILQNDVCKDVFRKDEFTGSDIYGCKTPWGGKPGRLITDVDIVDIKVWLARHWSIEPSTNAIFDAVNFILNQNKFHPVRDYLEALPEWDGVMRLDTWLRDCVGAEGPEPYVSDVSRKWLLAAVTRVYEPGAKFDHMVILEGLQGIGKSSIGYILAGKKWFLDKLPDLADKDAALNMRGMWFVEMAELANMKRSEEETVKAFITRQIDKVRPPYGRMVVELPRQNVFFGTTNSGYYLRDKTGNRRYWPVKVTHALDFEKLEAIRDQLWAEALWTYKNCPEPLWLDDEETRAQAAVVQESKVAEDEESAMAHALKTYMTEYKKEHGKIFGLTGFKINDLFFGFDAPLANFRMDNSHMVMASRVLQKAGFVGYVSAGRRKWRYQT